MIRSFLAIAIPEEIADEIADIQEALPGAFWTSPENLHLTVSFLGEQPPRTLEDLDAALAAAPPRENFSLTLAGVGTFGADARVAFAGVEAPDALLRLRASVERAARSLDIETDARKYAPHVTLARWRRREVSPDRLAAWIQANNLFRSGPFDADALTLFRSTLTRSGPVYEPMAEYPFA